MKSDKCCTSLNVNLIIINELDFITKQTHNFKHYKGPQG